MSNKVHSVAKSLGLSSAALIELLKEMGINRAAKRNGY
jgi:hypothetical protein